MHNRTKASLFGLFTALSLVLTAWVPTAQSDPQTIDVTLAADGFRGRFTHADRPTHRGAQAFPQLGVRKLIGDALELLAQIVCQRHAGERGARAQAAVELIRHMTDLDHLRHVLNMQRM